MKTFNSYAPVIENFYKTISDLVSEEIYLAFFAKICEEYDVKLGLNSQKDHWTNSKLRKLLEVFERIELIEFLEKEIANSEFHKKYFYPPLVTYLKLTCFDQLGSKESFKTYDEWINSKINIERDNLINSNYHKPELLKRVSKEYIKLYGVKNSFFNFLDEVVPIEKKESLMKCLVITSKYNLKNVYEVLDFKGDLSMLEKAKYLYKIRNNYTHNTYSARYSIINFFPISNDAWTLKDTFFVNNIEHGVLVSGDFESKLRDIIKVGLSEIIVNNK